LISAYFSLYLNAKKKKEKREVEIKTKVCMVAKKTKKKIKKIKNGTVK